MLEVFLSISAERGQLLTQRGTNGGDRSIQIGSNVLSPGGERRIQVTATEHSGRFVVARLCQPLYRCGSKCQFIFAKSGVQFANCIQDDLNLSSVSRDFHRMQGSGISQRRRRSGIQREREQSAGIEFAHRLQFLHLPHGRPRGRSVGRRQCCRNGSGRGRHRLTNCHLQQHQAACDDPSPCYETESGHVGTMVPARYRAAKHLRRKHS